MALIKCTECGYELSDKAKTCQHCGCPIDNMFIDNISNQKLKNLLINNKFVNKKYRNKQDFISTNFLYDEIYVPLVINGEGYSVNDIQKIKPIGFKKPLDKSANTLHIGDTININLINGEKETIVISQIYYSEVEFDLTEFSHSKYSKEYNMWRHYKGNPIELSDTDYEIAINFINNNNPNTSRDGIVNFIYNALSLLGIIIYIIGFIIGFIVQEEFEGFSLIVTWLAAFLTGTFMLGFANIIDILNSINKKL